MQFNSHLIKYKNIKRQVLGLNTETDNILQVFSKVLHQKDFTKTFIQLVKNNCINTLYSAHV